MCIYIYIYIYVAHTPALPFYRAGFVSARCLSLSLSSPLSASRLQGREASNPDVLLRARARANCISCKLDKVAGCEGRLDGYWMSLGGWLPRDELVLRFFFFRGGECFSECCGEVSDSM